MAYKQSIAPHSLPSDKLIIFSVYRQGWSSWNNKLNYKAVKGYLDALNIWYKEVKGCYNGIKELSFVIKAKHRKLAEVNAILFGQKTILLLSDNKAHGLRKAALYYLFTKTRIDIGYFRSRIKKEALKHDNYTYDPSTDTYYIVEEDYIKASQIS